MAQLGPWEHQPVIATAVSGGCDSMALLLLAKKWMEARGGKVVALTVDHGLRQNSHEEALQVGKWLAQHRIDHVILPWKGEKPSSNIQAEARKARYHLLTEWCRAHHILHLLVAHHADDQAETVMLRLMRGSGADGLAAMPSCTAVNGIRLLRPLLPLDKRKLQNVLKDAGWLWVEDPSNTNEQFDRVKCRNWLASQENPELISTRLFNTASQMGRVREILEKETALAMVRYGAIYPEGYATLAPEALRTLPEETGLRLLAALLRTIGGYSYKTRFSHLTTLYNALREENFTGKTLQHCVVFPYRGKIFFSREQNAIPTHTSFIPNTSCLWDGRFKLYYKGTEHAPLSITSLSPVLWNNFTSENQLLIINHRVKTLPKKILYTLPAILALEKVIAIPHINWVDASENCEIFCSFMPDIPVSGAYFRYSV